MRIVHNVKLSRIIYPFRQQCLRFGSQLARSRQADRRICAEGEQLLLAVEAIAKPPQPGACLADMDIQPAAISGLVVLFTRLELAKLNICKRHVRVS